MSPDRTPNLPPAHDAVDPAADRPQPRALSQHDPQTDSAATNRPPLLIVVIVVLLVSAVVALHLTGVLGPGSH
jgi:hypothetical protein